MSNLDKYKDDLGLLVKLGEKMEHDLTFRYLADQGELKGDLKKTAKNLEGSFEEITNSGMQNLVL